jgi:hypothetical protein
MFVRGEFFERGDRSKYHQSAAWLRPNVGDAHEKNLTVDKLKSIVEHQAFHLSVVNSAAV